MEEDGQLLSYIRMMYGLPEESWVVRGEGDEESTAIVIQIQGDHDVRGLVKKIERLLQDEVAP